VPKISKPRAQRPETGDAKKRRWGLSVGRLRSRIKNELYPLIRFIAFGLVAVILDLVTLNVSVSLGMPPTWAKIAGYVLALSFTLKFVSPIVFRSTNTPFRVFVTSLIYLSTGVINVLTFTIILGVTSNLNVAFLAGTVASASLNYAALRALTNAGPSIAGTDRR